jgi:hypothetical protein
MYIYYWYIIVKFLVLLKYKFNRFEKLIFKGIYESIIISDLTFSRLSLKNSYFSVNIIRYYEEKFA